MNPRILALLLCLALPLSAQQPATPAAAKLLPFDEATKDPSFLEFRTELQAAIARRDVAYVRSILSPDIKLNFGGDEGPEAFDRVWQPENPKTNLWQTLGQVLQMGGAFDGEGRFLAPYVFARWPEASDPFEHVVVVVGNARLRAAPTTKAKLVATLSHEIVKLADDPGDPKTAAPDGWARVQTLDGKVGFISEKLVRSPIDYRAIFEKRNGSWVMTIFLAGD